MSRERDAELKLRENELRFQQIAEVNQTVIWEVDKEGLFTFVSPTSLHQWGYRPDELVGKKYFFDLFPEESRETLKKDALELFTSKAEICDFFNHIVKADGSNISVITNGIPILDEKGDLIGYRGSDQDITDRLKAEEALKRSHELLEKITHQVPDIVFQFRISPNREMSFPYVSDRVKDIFNLTPEQVMNDASLVFNTYHVEDYPLVIKKFAKSASTLCDFESEHRALIPGKGLRWHLATARPEREEDGSILWHGTASDITERKQIEIRLRESQGELKNLVRIREEQHKRLMDFTHIVSHNLRSHTANLEGLLTLLKMEEPELFNHEYVQLMSRSSGYLSDTITDLNRVLDVNRVDEKQWEEINVRDLVMNIADGLYAKLKMNDVELVNSVAESITVRTIPRYLKNILENLMTNAIQFRSPDRNAYVMVAAEVKKGAIIIKVEDNGLGIELDRHQDKLFGMYNTFHTHKASLGLGLFISKNQAQAMSGDIRVESVSGKGSVFFVLLPVGQH